MRNFFKIKTRTFILTGAFFSMVSGIVHAEDLYETFPAYFNFTSLNGTNGFIINGVSPDYGDGAYVSGAGDVNGDGMADFLIGTIASGSYVIFGRKEAWPEKFNLTSLNGSNGFTIKTVNSNEGSGLSVGRAGDVNGDGIDDIIVGTLFSGDFSRRQGQGYVIFGSKERWSAKFNLDDLNGDNGFVIRLIDSNGAFVIFVSGVGDVNGDGIGDIIIGPQYDGNPQCQGYVVFGSKEVWPALVDLADLDGHNGFILDGINPRDGGFSISKAGDVNGDGVDDILIGIFLSNDSSQSYVVFGSKQPWPKNFRLINLNGRNGFSVDSGKPDDNNDLVSKAGDVNGDGIDDILIGAPGVYRGKGQSYIVFGSKKAWPAVINLGDLNGHNGFAINGIGPDTGIGFSVSEAGDVNWDGIDDFLIGAPYTNKKTGQSYAVFGRKEWDAVFNLTCLDGRNGFVLNGINEKDLSGASVKGVGDVNGDGIDDFLIGAPFARNNTGQTYVIFGRNGM